jgi:hypothetical protein
LLVLLLVLGLVLLLLLSLLLLLMLLLLMLPPGLSARDVAEEMLSSGDECWLGVVPFRGTPLRIISFHDGSWALPEDAGGAAAVLCISDAAGRTWGDAGCCWAVDGGMTSPLLPAG